MKIDHPRLGELSPLKTGFLTLDPDWAWLVRNDDDSIALSMTAGRLHDVVILQKPHIYAMLSVDVIHQLLRVVRDECLERGIRAFLMWYTPKWTEADLTLYRALEPYIQGRVQFDGEIVSGALSLMSDLGAVGQ
jgi:hypothetical protein